MPEYRGRLHAEAKRFAIVVAQFNDLITSRLLAGAQSAFWEHGVPEDAVDVVHIPGAFELPLVAKTLAGKGGYAAVICLGAVIRGATAHFEHVAGQSAAGIQAASRETGVPILFGVLTTDTIEQAIERAGTKSGNKGYDAAVDAIKMADLMDQLRSS
jgi:6,7-dimethyl-8-ribityllumazine synthase